MKCQGLFSGKNKKIIINLLPAEFAQTVIKVNVPVISNRMTAQKLLTLIQINILNDKQCRSRSVGFFRSQLIWIYTVCEGRAYPGSVGPGSINVLVISNHMTAQRSLTYLLHPVLSSSLEPNTMVEQL